MKRFLKVKRWCWFMLAASLAVLSAVGLLRWRGLPRAFHPDGERQALLAEKVRLAPFTAEQLQSLRSELARVVAQATTTEPVLIGNWQSNELPVGANGVSRTRYILTRFRSWAEVIRDMAQLEAGGLIESLDIRSQGNRHQRDIAVIEIVVAANPGTTRRQAGALFPEATGPARPRKIGPGLSLRLASAAASAPSRPDPPG